MVKAVFKQSSFSQVQSGFTLIELIVVIIILGILAVTAAPRFIDVSKEARVATLNGLAGTFRSSAQMIHVKAQISNIANVTTYTDLDYNGTLVRTRYGYFAYDPSPARAVADFEAILDVEIPQDWDFTYEPGVVGGQGAKRSRTAPSGLNTITDPRVINQISRCYVEYILPTAVGERPVFNINTDC
ncbi:MAG: prepilin-type N-terminal cleavage/methylation domain-containing protein [Psychrobium sp.]